MFAHAVAMAEHTDNILFAIHHDQLALTNTITAGALTAAIAGAAHSAIGSSAAAITLAAHLPAMTGGTLDPVGGGTSGLVTIPIV